MQRFILSILLVLAVSSQSFGAALITPAFSKFSSAGMSVDAGKQGTNTMRVIGATFSKPNGKPTMTVDLTGQTIKPDDVISKMPTVDVRAFMDGQSGRPTLAAWQASPSTVDVAAAIRAADAYANGKAVVIFQGETYLANSELTISSPWKGVIGKTKIVFGTAYAQTQAYGDPLDHSMVWNKNFTKAGYNSNADYIDIEGIYFQRKYTGNVFSTMLVLGNVAGGKISKCKFDSFGVVDKTHTNLDIFASVKNLTVETNQFYNETGNFAGGNIWVRNITTDAANVNSAVENIAIRDNLFVKDSGDESVAVSGVFSLVRAVVVDHNKFYQYGTTQGALFVAGIDPNPAYVATAELRDVKVSNNFIYTSSTTNEVLRAGVAGDNAAKLNDIVFIGNTIFYDAPSSGARAAIRKTVGTNVKAIENNIYNVGTAYAVQIGIYQVDESRGNVIKDLPSAITPMVTAIQGGRAINNTVDTTGTGFQDCTYANGNNVKAKLPFSVISNGQYDAFNNVFQITTTGSSANGVYYNNLGGASNPSGNLDNNTIICNDSTNHRAILFQGTGKLKLTNNNVTGSGKTVSGAITYAKDNLWYGVNDSFYNSSTLNSDLFTSLPYGHFVRNSSSPLNIDGNSNVLTGWVKAFNTTGTLDGEIAGFESFYAGANPAWVKGTGWTIPENGAAVFNGADGSSLSQNYGVGIIGDTYEVKFTVASISAGGFVARVAGTTSSNVRTAPGTYTERLVATSTSMNYAITSVGTTNGSISLFSVKHVTQKVNTPVYQKTVSQ